MNLREMALKARESIAQKEEMVFDNYLQKNSAFLLDLASRGFLTWEFPTSDDRELACVLKKTGEKFIEHPKFGPLTFRYKVVEIQRLDTPRILLKFGSPNDTI